MAAHGPCPSCGGALVELERTGVMIDACRQCRGVWLDRGELDKIIARERQVVEAAANDDEEFFREMSGQQKPKYGFDKQTADQLYRDYKAHRSHKSHKHKKRKSFLDELFD